MLVKYFAKKMAAEHSNRIHVFVVASMTFLASGQVTAADTATTESSAPIEVMVVTASGFESTLAEAPASISVVEPAEIKQQPIKDIVDVLKYLPGVTNQISQGGRNGIVIRGLDEDYVLRLVDGKRISSSTGIWRRNNFDNTTIPLSSIERIEVIRGPMSALYGSDAVGGVVNVITRKPSDEWVNNFDIEQSLMQQGKGGNRFRSSYFGSGKVSQDVGITLSAENSDQEAWYYDPVGLRKSITTAYNVIEPRRASKFSSVIDWQVANNQQLSLNIAHDNDEVLFSNFGNYTRSQHVERWTYGLTHTADWQWGGTELTFNQSDARMKDFNSRYIDLKATKRDERYLTPDEIYTTLRAVSHFDWGIHTLTAGFEYLETEVIDDIQYPVNGSDSLSLSSVFVQDQAELTDNLTVTAGLRAEDAEIYGVHVSPRAYLVYDLGDGITVKGGVGSAFRAPTLFEASPNFESISCGGRCFIYGNPELKEETSVSTELALLIDRDAWGASFTLYNNEVDELIEVGSYTGTHPRAGNTAYFNLDMATLRGVEASLQMTVTDAISIDTNYTFLEAKGPNDMQLAYRPKHNVNLRINYDLTDALSTYVGANYYGDYIHYRNRDVVPYKQSAYTLVDVGVRFQATELLALRGGITNTGSAQPIEKDLDSDIHLQGRAIFVGAEFNF
jgi:outer membrane receptor for ferrienterochelin and colicins